MPMGYNRVENEDGTVDLLNVGPGNGSGYFGHRITIDIGDGKRLAVTQEMVGFQQFENTEILQMMDKFFPEWKMASGAILFRNIRPKHHSSKKFEPYFQIYGVNYKISKKIRNEITLSKLEAGI